MGARPRKILCRPHHESYVHAGDCSVRAPAPETRSVTFLRREHPHWGNGYFQALVGSKVKMPAMVDATGHVLSGFLVAARETEDAIELEFSDLAAED